MVKFGTLAGVVAAVTMMGMSPSFALVPIVPAPAPEMGATMVGMILAAGIALYIRKRAKQ